jgi:hypothetical protein
MKKELPLISTYSQIILGGWPAIFEIVKKYTKVRKHLIRSDLPFLSYEQLEEVFLDSQNHFILDSISVRAKALLDLIHVQVQLDALEEEKEEAMKVLEQIEGYARNSGEENLKISQAFEEARQCVKDIKEAQSMLEEKKKHLAALNEKMDKLLASQDKEWENFRQEWASQLIEGLESAGIRLTELEVNEIKRQKTLYELIERMKELNLSLPKDLPEGLR